jgi:hypothetical protein
VLQISTLLRDLFRDAVKDRRVCRV